MRVASTTSNHWVDLLGAAVIISSAGVLAATTTSITDIGACDLERLGNGVCDIENNMEECGYDAGDCCQCTCTIPSDASDDEFRCYQFACIDPAAPCVADDDVTIDVAQNCIAARIGDGSCNIENNKEICDYDGGDCCSCTCVPPDDSYYSFCENFACIDPLAVCVDEDDITAGMVENCGFVFEFGNGNCDEVNNNELCGWDGGDCCECTCVPLPNTNPYTDDYQGCGNGFACLDPQAPCVNDDDITTGLVHICDEIHMANGQCSPQNNIPECNYDGGDCCACTCEDQPNITCGPDFLCIDPEAPCVDDDDVTIDVILNCEGLDVLGNGNCDLRNNNEQCNYDRGDCCECTCDPTNAADDDGCGPNAGFACIDPMAPCSEDDSITVDMIDNCFAQQIGDGFCDLFNNRAACAYDGGDCCECTCVGDNCKSFAACVDPDAPCVNDDDITVDKLECPNVQGIGDGYCNDENNTPECGYDGGDCCECTCVEPAGGDDYSDGYNPPCSNFSCLDAGAPCFENDDQGGQGPAAGDDDVGAGFMSYEFIMSFDFIPWTPEEGPFPIAPDAVEVGTKTEVGVSATAYDTRPGLSSGSVGCGLIGGDGCAPENTRDGISGDVESRWSCASKIVEFGGPCQIEYTFAEPQNIVGMEIAFWKGDERTRNLQVFVDGMFTRSYESYGGSTFNTFSVEADGVSTVMLEATNLLTNEWISLIEVLIFVTP